MDMKYSQERQLLQETVRKFCAVEFESEKLRAMIDAEPHGMTDAVWARIAEQGWIGVMVPEAHGGLGLGATELALICEEMGRRVAPGPFFSTAALAAPALAIGGSESAKAALLPRIVEGELRATLALLEADAQLGPSHVRTTARRDGDGWILDGEKFFVPDAAGAGLIIVAARTGAAEDAVSLFAVDAKTPGLTIRPNRLTDVTSRSAQVDLEGVRVSGASLVGELDRGWAVVDQVLAFANVCLAGEAIGGAERIFTMTLAYVKERHQFGSPIGSFQAVKHPLADLYAEIESARSAYHYAAWAVDAASPDARVAMAVARLTCVEAYRRVTLGCLQAHGGIGFTWEYDLHFFLKRAKHDQCFLGLASDYEEIVAREALRI